MLRLAPPGPPAAHPGRHSAPGLVLDAMYKWAEIGADRLYPGDPRPVRPGSPGP